MKIVNRKSINDKLKKYNPCFKDSDYIEITEWVNGEGWDINMTCSDDFCHISLHRDELEAINYLTKTLEYENSSNK